MKEHLKSVAGADSELGSLHLLMQLLQTVDVGLILINEQHEVQLWNSFVENHSGIHTNEARGGKLFTLFPELPEQWLKRKIDSVFKLRSRAYSTWEQFPRLFNFRSARPLTGKSELMYQNVTLIPLEGVNKSVSQVCLLIYDVTDVATNKLELQAANQALEVLSRTDRLTGLFNRGHFEEQLEKEYRRCHRSGASASLLMLDIDYFKPVNDTYGHQAGDAVLRALAELLLMTQRDTDVAGRYGGEEFAIILPDTTVEQAGVLAERVRSGLARLEIPHEEVLLKITVSIGIAQFDTSLESAQRWMEVADQAMYQSKAQGRDRTSIKAV